MISEIDVSVAKSEITNRRQTAGGSWEEFPAIQSDLAGPALTWKEMSR